MRLSIALLHKIQVEPYLVMAALIGQADDWSFVEQGKSTVLRFFPPFI